MRFANQKVIVSGGGSGIGRATALAFAREGARVWIVGRDEKKLTEVADQYREQITPFVCDVGDTEKWCNFILEQNGLNILINNAAISISTNAFDPGDHSWREILDINFEGTRYASIAAAQAMGERGGRIVNVTSIHGTLCEAKSAAYGVAKAALNQLTRCLAVEFSSRGILVNAVAPGFVDTPMSRAQGFNELETEWFHDNFIKNGRIPLRRAAQPEEIAPPILFLASRENTYMTGQILVADGGLTITL